MNHKHIDTETMTRVHVIGNIAGNIRSLVNALEAVGVEVCWVTSPVDILEAKVINQQK